jgi:dihydrofolate reductase
MFSVTILVAYDENRVIGNQGKIPWHIPEDFKLFKKRTIGHSVVMGRKTWESLPKRPLFDRVNVVISKRYSEEDPEGFMQTITNQDGVVFCIPSLESAMHFLRERFSRNRIFIIGGAQVYKEALDLGVVDKIIVSKIKGNYDGDTYFPELDDSWCCNELVVYDKFSVVEITRS